MVDQGPKQIHVVAQVLSLDLQGLWGICTRDVWVTRPMMTELFCHSVRIGQASKFDLVSSSASTEAGLEAAMAGRGKARKLSRPMAD